MRSLIKRLIPHKLFVKIEPFGHLLETVLWQVLAGFPARKLKVIGVTGTDGKTTTSTLIAEMLRHSGKKVAMLTTISLDLGDGNGPQPNSTRLTTMGSRQLVKKLQQVRNSGAEWLVLEVTSHALAQNRVWGIPFSVGVFTNLKHEHLDYHKTFENYRNAKKRLFTLVDKNRAGLRTAVVNADDPTGEIYADEVPNAVTYGIDSGELRATKVMKTASGSSYTVKTPEETYNITCNLPGGFNVYNSLAVLGVGRAIGLSKSDIEDGIASLQSVEGRMARIDEGQDFEVIIDYAHTPDSFQKIFDEIKPTVKGKLIVVFGSAGRRDEAKRAEQGRLAGKYADIVVVTEEDDRDIDGQTIMAQIAAGCEEFGKKQGKDLFLVHKREEAVNQAIRVAKKGDVVLLLGKGHEKSILGNKPGVLNTEADNYDEATMTLSRPYGEERAARDALRSR